MKALFDADIIVFRAGFAAERNQWHLLVLVEDCKGGPPWEAPETYAYKKDALARLDEVLPGQYSRTEGEQYRLWSERDLEPVSHATHNAKVLINKCLEAVDCTEFDAIMYLSGEGKNFRHEAAKTSVYKGNRDNKHRPTHEQAVRDYIRHSYETVVTDGIEADDALGIAQKKYGPHESVIISLDKDLDMIPGLKYNFVNEVHYDVTPEIAWRKFCTQLLTGDAVDNIPGLKGVGVKKADTMLKDLHEEELMDEVLRQYASRTLHEDWYAYLIEQATLIWIQQEPDQAPPIPTEEEWGTFGEEDAAVETDLYG